MLARVCLSLLLCSLLACGGNTRAPVEDRYPGSVSTSGVYYVQRGETLYSIAFRYGLDYRKVAAANSIAAPYTIYPGQKIYLKEATPPPTRRASAPATTTSTASTATPARSTPPVVSTPAAKPVPKPAPVSKTSSAPATRSSPGGTYSAKPVSSWRWPTSGRVTRGYSTSVHKGIDIGGKRGDAIYAVAAGKVVYSGTGIVGFGELLIVKHNEVYLSAYGHNNRLLVAEGDTVRAGQKIAEKGSSGTDTVKLHFEIRKEGKPIDPQRVLPRR